MSLMSGLMLLSPFIDAESKIKFVQQEYARECAEKVLKMDKDVLGPIIEHEFAVCIVSEQLNGLLRKRENSYNNHEFVFEECLRKYMKVEALDSFENDYGGMYARLILPKSEMLRILETDFTEDFFKVPPYEPSSWAQKREQKWHKQIKEMGPQQAFDAIRRHHHFLIFRWQMRGVNVMLRTMANYLKAFLQKGFEEDPEFMNHERYRTAIQLGGPHIHQPLEKELNDGVSRRAV